MVIVRNLTEYLKDTPHKGKSGKKTSTSSKIWIYSISTADSFGLYYIHFECEAIFKDYLPNLFILRVSRLKYHKRKDVHTEGSLEMYPNPRDWSSAVWCVLYSSLSLVVLSHHCLTHDTRSRNDTNLQKRVRIANNSYVVIWENAP